MHFGAPDNLYLLLGLIPLAGIAVWYGWWRTQMHRRIGDPELVDRMTTNHSQPLRWTRIGIMLVGVGLLCLAAAEPRWGRTNARIDKQGVDVVFALDLSKSMLARDIQPSRLQAASNEIQTSLERLDGDRAGLVVFTAVSFTQSPLTTDYGAIRFYLDKLDPSQMSVGGTAIGRALRDSTALLTGESPDDEESSETADMDRAKNQVIVLITDGEDHDTNPMEAAQKAREHGIHVVTVGIGKKKGVKIPELDRNGNVTGYKRRGGDIVKTRLEEQQLRDIATEVGGRYVRYAGPGSVTDELSEFIESLEKSQFEAEMAQQYHDRFMWFLVPGAILLLLSMVIGERSDGVLGWQTGDDEPAIWTGGLFGLVLLVSVGLVGCEGALTANHAEVERGKKLLEEQRYDEAAEAFEKAADDDQIADSPELAYNRGLAEFHRDNFEEARPHFARALESTAPERQFSAHYHIGLTLANQEKWKEAAESFRDALAVAGKHPDTIDGPRVSKARRNVERAYRKLYPPCESMEDDREDNDSADNATRLKEPEAEELTLCGGDDDWFAVPVVPGTTVTVEATFRQLRDPADPTRPFLPNPEDLSIALLDASGRTNLARDRGVPDGDADPDTDSPVDRTITEFTVGEDVELGSENPAILLRASAKSGLGFEYDLNLNIEPPCRAKEDKFEENDTRADAADLSPGQHKAHKCAGDEDWYRVTADADDTLFVDVAPRGGGGDDDKSAPKPDAFDVELIDPDSGETVATGRSDGPFSTLGVRDLESAREFLLKVTADDYEGQYSLDVYRYAPCIVGDDKHEENDTADQAARFEGKSTWHRYLRLCPDDPDFFAFQTPKAKQKQRQGQGDANSNQNSQSDDSKNFRLGLAFVDSPGGTDDGENSDDAGDTEPDVEFDAITGNGARTLASGRTPAPAPSKPSGSDDASGDSEPPEPPFDRVLDFDPGDRKSVTVRVRGESTFYHLAELSGTSRSQQKKSNDQKKQNKSDQKQSDQKNSDQKKSDQKQSDQKNSDQKKSDQKRSENDESDKQTSKSDEGDERKEDRKQDGQKDGDDPKQAEKREQKEQKPSSKDGDEKRAGRKESEADQRKKERVRDLLKALEDSDTNFQMRKALEDAPDQSIDKDW